MQKREHPSEYCGPEGPGPAERGAKGRAQRVGQRVHSSTCKARCSGPPMLTEGAAGSGWGRVLLRTTLGMGWDHGRDSGRAEGRNPQRERLRGSSQHLWVEGLQEQLPWGS